MILFQYIQKSVYKIEYRFLRCIPGVGTGTVILPAGVSFQSQELSWNAELPRDLGSTTIDMSIMNYYLLRLERCMESCNLGRRIRRAVYRASIMILRHRLIISSSTGLTRNVNLKVVMAN